jgi:hypothetical protein
VPRPSAPPSRQKTFKPSTSIVLDSICVAPVSFTDTSPSAVTTVAAAAQVDNLAFAITNPLASREVSSLKRLRSVLMPSLFSRETSDAVMAMEAFDPHTMAQSGIQTAAP